MHGGGTRDGGPELEQSGPSMGAEEAHLPVREEEANMEAGAGRVVNLVVKERGSPVSIASVPHMGLGGENLGAGGYSEAIAWNR